MLTRRHTSLLVPQSFGLRTGIELAGSRQLVGSTGSDRAAGNRGTERTGRMPERVVVRPAGKQKHHDSSTSITSEHCKCPRGLEPKSSRKTCGQLWDRWSLSPDGLRRNTSNTGNTIYV